MAIESINPTTGKRRKRYKPHRRPQIEAALAAAENASALWRARPFADRAAVLRRAASVLRRDRHLPRLIAEEMGKPLAQGRGEIEKCAWACEYYADHGSQLLQPESVPTEALRSYVRFDPLGIILAVMPWNFPFWQVFRCAAPALMAGNVILLKHASNVPECAVQIEDVWRRARLPKGAFQTLLVEADAVEGLIADRRVAAVTLTGSGPAGQKVAATAGRYLKKSILELGGADPFIVLPDADLDACCAAAALARTINSGQSCIAAKRFIVERTILKSFTERFVEEMQALRVADPLAKGTQVGPLARADLVDELDQQVQRSIQRGARLLAGGTRLPGPGFFYLPTVLGDVRPGMPAYDEEMFGPVASIIAARDADDAVRIANDSCFGLGASIWSADRERAERMAARLDAGIVHINDIVKSDPRLPFGGIKESGYGRELGAYGIKELTNIKTVVVQ